MHSLHPIRDNGLCWSQSIESVVMQWLRACLDVATQVHTSPHHRPLQRVLVAHGASSGNDAPRPDGGLGPRLHRRVQPVLVPRVGGRSQQALCQNWRRHFSAGAAKQATWCWIKIFTSATGQDVAGRTLSGIPSTMRSQVCVSPSPTVDASKAAGQ